MLPNVAQGAANSVEDAAVLAAFSFALPTCRLVYLSMILYANSDLSALLQVLRLREDISAWQMDLSIVRGTPR